MLSDSSLKERFPGLLVIFVSNGDSQSNEYAEFCPRVREIL